MRISLVTETYSPEINGVAKTLSRLVEDLKQRGHLVQIVRPKQASDTRGNKELMLTRGLPIPGYPGLQFGLPAGRRLKKAWYLDSPDIVYVATEGPLGYSAVKVANNLGIPVLSGFHTNFHSYSQHYRVGMLRPLIFKYLKNFHNRTQCTLAPSPGLVEDLKTEGIHKTTLFSRGIDNHLYSPDYRNRKLRNEWQATDKDPVLLYVGRIAAEKNIRLIIDSYYSIKQLKPSSKLIMVGDGPLRKKLLSKYPDIIFSGPKTGNELSRHYASADYFLFPSETETFGNVILEAMASGLAVLAYDYAAAHMHIRNRDNGVVVNKGDASAFQAAARNLVQDAELSYRVRQQARQTAMTHDWAKVIDNFETLMVTYAQSKPDNQQDPESSTVSANGRA